MKSRQLANVLIKLLGFCICLFAIPECLGGILLYQFSHSSAPEPDTVSMRIIFSVVGGGIQAALGIIIRCAPENCRLDVQGGRVTRDLNRAPFWYIYSASNGDRSNNIK